MSHISSAILCLSFVEYFKTKNIENLHSIGKILLDVLFTTCLSILFSSIFTTKNIVQKKITKNSFNLKNSLSLFLYFTIIYFSLFILNSFQISVLFILAPVLKKNNKFSIIFLLISCSFLTSTLFNSNNFVLFFFALFSSFLLAFSLHFIPYKYSFSLIFENNLSNIFLSCVFLLSNLFFYKFFHIQIPYLLVIPSLLGSFAFSKLTQIQNLISSSSLSSNSYVASIIIAFFINSFVTFFLSILFPIYINFNLLYIFSDIIIVFILIFTILSSNNKKDIPNIDNNNNNNISNVDDDKKKQVSISFKTLLSNESSRNIFFFLSLNFLFMIIQFSYSIFSHSLGLLSDSIHMFFDCLALLIGLFASLLSQLPPSTEFPYGLGKVETVSGFANGVLLVGISVGIFIEAIERLWFPVELERTSELLVVSVLGLAVNLVGIYAFNHGHHHGHGHGHDHHHHGPADHSHSHSNNHSHNHAHGMVNFSIPFLSNWTRQSVSESLAKNDAKDDKESEKIINENNENRHLNTHEHQHKHDDYTDKNEHKDTHTHDHDDKHHKQTHNTQCEFSSQENSNMQGIFLHILADTLGSVSVILSTLFTKIFGYYWLDSLASMFIAFLIFISAIPLVKSTANALLLTVSPEMEYILRNILDDVSVNISPFVVSYSEPRFWSDEGGIKGIIHVQVKQETSVRELNDIERKIRNRMSDANVNDVYIQIEYTK